MAKNPKDCIGRVVKASNGAVNRETAREMLMDVDRIAKRKTGKKGIAYSEAVAQEIGERAAEVKSALQQRKLKTLRQIKIKAETMARNEAFIAQGMTVKKARQADLVGVQGRYEEGRLSAAALQEAAEADVLGSLVYKLEKEGLLKAFNSRQFEDDIGRELNRYRKDVQIEPTGNETARRIAAIVHEAQEGVRLRQNRAGAEIGDVGGFSQSQKWNPARLSKMGIDRFKADLDDLLDHERTFGDEDPDAFLSGAFKALVTGVRLDAPDTLKDAKLYKFAGPANLAKKVSAARLLHFKDYDSFKKANDAYGTQSLTEGIIDGLRHGARNAALMERYGDNPEAMNDAVTDALKKKYRDTLYGKFVDRSIKNFYSEVSGSVNRSVNPRAADIGASIRAVESMAKLGGAAITSMMDIPIKAMQLQRQGEGFLGSYARSFGDIFAGLGREERVELASLLRVGFESQIADAAGRFSVTDGVPGRLSKLQRLFFKLNLLGPMTDQSKRGMGRIMAHRLAQLSGKEFADLGKPTLEQFRLYGIGEPEWAIYRKAVSEFSEGRNFVTTDALAEMPDEIFAGYARDRQGIADPKETDIARARDSLSTRLLAYYTDRAEHAVLEPGARERAILRQGQERGTLLGEALRYMGQFKQFPVTFLTKTWGEALYSKGKADMPMIAQLILSMTVFGYLAMSAKDVIAGKEPRNPADGDTIIAAILQGGAFGIYGDYLFGEYNKYDQSITEVAAGPTAGSIADIVKLWHKMRGTSDPDVARDAAANAVKLIRSHVPGNNIFWLKPAFDMLLVYPIQEWANPGYLRRNERRIKKEKGQEFWIKPSEVVR